jgi:hypothetical protein
MSEETITIKRSDFEKLLRSWEHSAKRKFWDAEKEKDPMGKRLIEHGAMVYFNCGRELSKIIGQAFPLPSLSDTL